GVSVTVVGSKAVTSVPSTKTTGLAAAGCWVGEAPAWAGAAWGAVGWVGSRTGLAGAGGAAGAQAASRPPARPTPLRSAARRRKARRETGAGRTRPSEWVVSVPPSSLMIRLLRLLRGHSPPHAC